jgi:hypothetical protein
MIDCANVLKVAQICWREMAAFRLMMRRRPMYPFVLLHP